MILEFLFWAFVSIMPLILALVACHLTDISVRFMAVVVMAISIVVTTLYRPFDFSIVSFESTIMVMTMLIMDNTMMVPMLVFVTSCKLSVSLV